MDLSPDYEKMWFLGVIMNKTLESLLDRVIRIKEYVLYTPIDAITIPFRDHIIPRSIKKQYPVLSCRRYSLYQDEVFCQPSGKYLNRDIMAKVCPYYDLKENQCTKKKLGIIKYI